MSFAFIGKTTKAQFVVTDPTNLAQGVVNSSHQILEHSKTAAQMFKNFQETSKIYEQGKVYYDALKKVHNLVRDARRVQMTILMIGEITDIYVTNFELMIQDDNYELEELTSIGIGYALLLDEANEVLKELQNVINVTTLSLSDKDRMDVVEDCYQKVKHFRNLVRYYTNKNIGVTLFRSRKEGDTERVFALYGSNYERYWYD